MNKHRTEWRVCYARQEETSTKRWSSSRERFGADDARHYRRHAARDGRTGGRRHAAAALRLYQQSGVDQLLLAAVPRLQWVGEQQHVTIIPPSVLAIHLCAHRL